MLQKPEDIRHERFLEEITKLNLRFPGKEIVKRTGYKSGIVSEYLNSKKSVSESFLREFSKAFNLDYEKIFGVKQDKAATITKPGKPGDPANMKWAMLKMLYQRMVKSEAARLGLPIEQVMKDMDDETMINWHDLESGNAGK
jgi:transcriptional regulator with XRE-family HTH domain